MSVDPLPGQSGADEVCQAIEGHLGENLASYLGDLKAVGAIVQGPSPDAVQSGLFPVVCISSPGLAEPPEQGRDGYSATWIVMVSVWVRGINLSNTAVTTRRYVTALRSCLLAWGRGAWTDEGYAQVPDPEAAGTMGGGFVELHVYVADAADLTQLPVGAPLPQVTATAVTVSPKE